MERAAQEQKNLTARIQENLEAQKQTEDRLKALTPAYQEAQKPLKKQPINTARKAKSAKRRHRSTKTP